MEPKIAQLRRAIMVCSEAKLPFLLFYYLVFCLSDLITFFVPVLKHVTALSGPVLKLPPFSNSPVHTYVAM